MKDIISNDYIVLKDKRIIDIQREIKTNRQYYNFMASFIWNPHKTYDDLSNIINAIKESDIDIYNEYMENETDKVDVSNAKYAIENETDDGNNIVNIIVYTD